MPIAISLSRPVHHTHCSAVSCSKISPRDMIHTHCFQPLTSTMDYHHGWQAMARQHWEGTERSSHACAQGAHAYVARRARSTCQHQLQLSSTPQHLTTLISLLQSNRAADTAQTRRPHPDGIPDTARPAFPRVPLVGVAAPARARSASVPSKKGIHCDSLFLALKASLTLT
jgi:hypothetical protein